MPKIENSYEGVNTKGKDVGNQGENPYMHGVNGESTTIKVNELTRLERL